MASLSNFRGNIRSWLKGYLFLGVAVMILAMLLYSNHLIGRMRDNSQATGRLFSRYMANVLFEVADDGSLADLRAVIADANLPIIITVLDGRPILWAGVPVDERTEEDFQMLITLDVDNPPTEKLRRLIEMYRAFDRINEPIPIRVVGTSEPQGFVHYGNSAIERELRLMPFIQLAIFLVFMGLAIQGLRYLKLSEQRSIWVGLAKETAHQLGTPISALLGWVQLIKDKAVENDYRDILGSVSEMEVDLQRLNKVTDRFSKIGAQPELVEVELRPVLERTVDYFQRRLPRVKKGSSLVLRVDGDPRVRGNEELLEWVFENLIKNGLDALGDRGGKVEIRVALDDRRRFVDATVSDTGRGIAGGMRDRVFEPGVTSKRRGWGLGLTLARRIVADYHGGTIRVADSSPGRGTTFQVRLPVA